MIAKTLIAVLAGGTILLTPGAPGAPAPPQDAAAVARGKDLFARRCSGCHAADIDKEGPRLRGVYGRKAAGVPGFTYSDALKKVAIRWDDATLDRWLTDPDAMAPDTDMGFRLTNSEERKAVIDYLKTLGNLSVPPAPPPASKQSP
jgi:cytochrome c